MDSVTVKCKLGRFWVTEEHKYVKTGIPYTLRTGAQVPKSYCLDCCISFPLCNQRKEQVKEIVEPNAKM